MKNIGRSTITLLFFIIFFSTLILTKSGYSQTSQSPNPTDVVNPTPNYSQYVDYAVDVYAGPGGKINGINGHDSYFAYPGSSFDFAITPDTGYKIVDVTDNGVSQGAIKTYRLPNVQTSHIINATFLEIVTQSPSPTPNPTPNLTPTSTPTPTVPEFSWLAIFLLCISLLALSAAIKLRVSTL
jgi:hypothetical protein